MNRAVTLLIATLLSPPVMLFAADASPTRPNIILILADDLGAKELSYYGNREYKTPNLDRMASEGMRFEKYDTNRDGSLSKEEFVSMGKR